MLNLKTASALSIALLISGTASAEPRSKQIDVDVEKTTVIKLDKRTLDYDLDIDQSKHVKNDVDIQKKSIDGSFNKTSKKSIADSFNTTTKKSIADSFNTTTQFSKSVFANPVANGSLSATVTKNSVEAGALGFAAVASNWSGAALSGSAVSGFKGVNAMNINGGPNAVLQSNVSISVVSTQY